MIKSLTILILFTLVIQIFTNDCGTPLECYMKAIQALQEDREMIKNERELYKFKLDEALTKMEKNNEVYKTKLDETNQKLEKMVAETKQQCTTSVEDVKKTIFAPFNYLSAPRVILSTGTFTSNVTAYPLNLAKTTKKFLIYASYVSGGCTADLGGFVTIFNKYNGQEQKKYLQIKTYNQNAYTINSEVMEMDYDGQDSNLYIIGPWNKSDHFSLEIKLLAEK